MATRELSITLGEGAGVTGLLASLEKGFNAQGLKTTEMSVVLKQLDVTVEFLLKKLALDFYSNVKASPPNGGTPVDTGFARANWVPHIGRERSDASGYLPKGSTREDRERFAKDAEATSEAGAAAIATGYKIEMGPIFISNNVPYIGMLNFGSSRQAPAGFVERAIVKAVTEDSAR